MHLTEARLAEADHTADERAHLQSCVRCRLGARRLNVFLDDAPPSIIAPDAQRYTAVRSLGVGGMSQVVLSVDSRLGREVARKKLRTVTSARDVERFVREANITARLEHPNIVPVYDLEVDPQGSPTLTMRVVRGKSLGEAMRTGTLPDRRARLEVFLKVCDAVAFAHSKGVVHRDLKPDNVMVGEFGEVQVVDFGLAAQEAIEVDGEVGGSAMLTRSGTVMGTPAYMSPEQARGENDQVGPASDVYGLGATLWEIASGRPPFVGEADAVVAEVALGRVPSPREVDRSVPKDLAAIVLRAMATDPGDRYPDVSALRRDVVSFLAHAPVSARVPTISDRLAKWFVRNRTTVMPVAATAVLAVLVLIAGLAEWARQATTARDAEREQRIRVNLEAGSRAFVRDEPIEALPYFAQVLRLVLGTDQERDARARLRSAFERVPHIVSMVRTEPWSNVDLSMPTGRIAAIGKPGIQVWDASGKLTVAGTVSDPLPQTLLVAWSPDGAALAIASTVDVEIRRTEDLALLSEPLAGSGAQTGMYKLWWSGEGNRIFFDQTIGGSDRLRAYDSSTAEAIDAWRTPPDVDVVALSPSGIVGQEAPSPDGLFPLALFDAETGRKIRDLVDVEAGDFPIGRGSAGLVALRRNTPGLVDIVPLAAPHLLRSVRHRGHIYAAVFSPDGRLLATGSQDGTARVWDTRTGSGVIPFLPHLDQVFAISFPDDRYLMTGSGDGLVRVWLLPPEIDERAGANAAIAVDASDRFALVPEGLGLSCEDLHDGRTLGRLASRPVLGGQPVQRAGFDASGRWSSVNWTAIEGALLDVASCRVVFEGNYDGGTWNPVVPIFLGDSAVKGEDFLWTPDRGKEPRPEGFPAWSPDGGKVALADGTSIRIWDPATGDVRTISKGSECWLVTWGPSIAAGCQDGVRLLDPGTGRLLRTLGVLAGSLGWSPDGRRLAVAEGSGLVTVWDVASGSRLAATTVPVTPVTFLGFGEDGRYLAGRGRYRGPWTVWNASTGELVARLPLGATRPPTLTPSGIIVGLKIPTDDLSVADWLDIAELYALQRVTETGVDIPTPERVYDLWQGLAERDPADFRFDPSAVAP